MNALTYAELLAGLFSAVGAGILVMVAATRSPRLLQDEISQRIQRSIALIDGCKDRPTR